MSESTTVVNRLPLHEQYRPTSFDAVVGQGKAVKRIQAVLSRGWGGRAWWITGASGTGKTTCARIIASLGSEELNVHELDAGTLTPTALQDIERDMQYRGMGAKQGKAYVVNEAHGLRKDTIRLLLVLLERLPSHVCWLFTTTKAGQERLFECDTSGDASPLLSRCVEITLENSEDTQRAFAARAREIAKAEGMDGLPESVYRQAACTAKGNMRQLLQRIESGAFREDAAGLFQRELDMLKSTKGDNAAKRREELTTLLARLAE